MQSLCHRNDLPSMLRDFQNVIWNGTRWSAVCTNGRKGFFFSPGLWVQCEYFHNAKINYAIRASIPPGFRSFSLLLQSTSLSPAQFKEELFFFKLGNHSYWKDRSRQKKSECVWLSVCVCVMTMALQWFFMLKVRKQTSWMLLGLWSTSDYFKSHRFKVHW